MSMNLAWLTSVNSWPLWFEIVLVVSFGLCFGSFANVVILRLPRGRSIIKPSSRCGFCRSSISSWMNLPLLSFIWSGGTCQRCGHAYSSRYFWVELMVALLFLAVWSVYGFGLAFGFMSLFALALVIITWIDIDLKIIPDSLSLGGWGLGIALSLMSIQGWPVGVIESVAASILGFLFMLVISQLFYFVVHEEGLGFGDVKFMGMIGSFLGFQGIILGIVVGAVLGAVVGLALLIIYRKSRKTPIPFGPFLAVGALLALFQIDVVSWMRGF